MEVQNIVWIYITCRDEQEALKIGREMVRQKLAACANILPGMTSVYEWNGEITEDNECVLILKTQFRLYPDLEKAVISLHSYQVPCIMCFQAETGNAAYLQWIFQSTQITP
ncbi:MAG: divalent-cation tolerance protein CutA [Bacteroidia bacterium]|nr:divalent-cation tolerance protein CutA [Bacteroidia bacterium]